MIIVLIASGLVYLYSINSFLDILGNDESMYLYWGITFPKDFPIPEYSPLYIIWYKMLYQLQRDTILLYFLNYKAMSILPSLLIYVFLRINRLRILISFFCSILFLISFANFPTWPKVNHFVLIIILSGLIISSLRENVKYKSIILTLCMLLASFVRPEFFISFIIASIIITVIYVREFLKIPRFESIKTLLFTYIISVILLIILGFPAGSGNRTFDAFGQHYARNWVQTHNDPRDPYYNYKAILENDFGKVNSFSQAVMKNPYAIANHIFLNSKGILQEVRIMFLMFYPYGYPSDAAKIIVVLILFLLLLFLLIKGMLRKPDKYLIQVKENFRYFRFNYIIFFTIVIPGIVSVLLIYPRRHYLLVLVLITILMIVATLFRYTDSSNIRYKYFSCLLALLISVVLIRPLNSIVKNSDQDNLKALRYMQTLNTNERVKILEAWGIYSIYLGKNYKRVPEYHKDIPFLSYLEKWSINMIVVSERIMNDTRFYNDPEWIEFIKNPSEYGFVSVEIPDVKEIKLLVKNNLLKK